MLNNISKLLTGDILKVLSDMGHGDEIIIADANFPGETMTQRLIRVPGTDVASVYEAIFELFPLDAEYTEHPACVMEITEGDRKKGIPVPATWGDYENILHKRYPELKLGKIERYAFYERTKKAYAVIITGEERIYGNLLLKKGIVEPKR